LSIEIVFLFFSIMCPWPWRCWWWWGRAMVHAQFWPWFDGTWTVWFVMFWLLFNLLAAVVLW